MRWIASLFLILTVVGQSAAQTGGGPSGGGSSKQLQELMKILDEETTIATKTKLNSDYVPGTVTVLQGKDLEALGITTVWEALSLVPGIQVYRSISGDPFVTVRGLQFPFNSGNIKIMVNSIPMSRETSSINTSALLLPIEEVDRIEVIRGPGSSVYGSFAFMGLVNIITRKNENGAFVSVAGKNRYAGGARMSAGNRDVHFNANIAGWTSNDGEGPIVVGNPAAVKPKERRLSGVASLEYRNTSLSYQAFYRKYTANQYESERNQDVALHHHQALSGNWNTDLRVNYLNSRLAGTNVSFQGDLVHGEADLGWTGRRTNWLFALSGTRARIDSASLGGLPQNTVQVRNSGWKSFGVSLQGQLHAGEAFTATAGLRYDERVDLHAKQVTPRLAFVWRVREHHLVKAQYSEGFRAPTFFELSRLSPQITHLDFETVSTTELSYVFREPRCTARATLFDSQFKNMLYPFGGNTPQQPPGGQGPASGGQGPPPGAGAPLRVFRNLSRATSRGVELEWEQQLFPAFKWGANLSYATARDTRNDSLKETPAEGMAKWLANLDVIVRPRHDLVFSGHLYHVGKRYTRTGDVAGYDRLDLSVNLFNLGVNGLTLRGSVRNALNETIRYVVSLPTGPVVEVYDGRTWWLQLGYGI